MCFETGGDMEAGGAVGTQRWHRLAHCLPSPPAFAVHVQWVLGTRWHQPHTGLGVGSPAEKPVLEQRCLYRKDKLRLGLPA